MDQENVGHEVQSQIAVRISRIVTHDRRFDVQADCAEHEQGADNANSNVGRIQAIESSLPIFYERDRIICTCRRPLGLLSMDAKSGNHEKQGNPKRTIPELPIYPADLSIRGHVGQSVAGMADHHAERRDSAKKIDGVQMPDTCSGVIRTSTAIRSSGRILRRSFFIRICRYDGHWHALLQDSRYRVRPVRQIRSR